MNRFNLSFMILVQIDPCPPEKMELPPELSEVRPSLVKDPGIINQYDFEALPDNADTELQVLSHTGDSVAACSFKYLFLNDHIKTPGLEDTVVATLSPEL